MYCVGAAERLWLVLPRSQTPYLNISFGYRIKKAGYEATSGYALGRTIEK